MANHLVSQWDDNTPIRDCPAYWGIKPKIDHETRQPKKYEVHKCVLSKDSIHTDEKACAFEFFGRRRPLNVDVEEMT